ncbi:MAG TPA: cupin domain-containing protein [Nitrososphaeraceae archaeon]|nr:cupin domain-containing protein [Nitrososphaeraceae archaeon]
MHNTGFSLKDGEGVAIHFRGTKITVKVSKEDSEGKYTMLEMVHPSNLGPALHIHPDAPEAYYILEGEYQITCGKEVYHAQRGDFVFIPKRIEHKYQSGSNGGKVLVICPAGLEKYFREIAETLRIGPITWELEQEIARRYGQEFLEGLKHWGQ